MKFFLKFIFHRVTFILISAFLQLFVLTFVIIKFNQYFIFFYAINIVLSIVAVLYILYKNTNPAYKIVWIVPIVLFPLFGGLFYLFFGGSKLSRRTKRKMTVIIDKLRFAVVKKEEVLKDIRLESEAAASQSRYIQNYSLFPPYKNSSTEYFATGEEAFKKIKEELSKAKKYIFLEYFIIGRGVMWDSVLEILTRKVKEGVEVRVIYDDVGCLFTLPNGYHKTLEKIGIKCCVFNPVLPIVSFKFNNRDHRKIAVIDGIVGFTGGINLADEYINKRQKYGYWKDTVIMVEGEAVWNFTAMFLSMWNFLRGIDENFYDFKTEIKKHNTVIKGYVQPFADSPLDNETVSEIIYMNLINKANRYVYITTPYLVIGNELVMALTSAAKGGVDVRIITPRIPDKKIVNAVTKSYYKILIESGVKIYEYIPGFIHSKTYVSDDEYGVVGSINMDFRSLYLHFECGVWLYKTQSVYDIKKDFINTLKSSYEVTREDIKKVKWYSTLWRVVLRIFAPLM
ncbi:cardiolipin synthase [Clostridium felsineum]|uniref:Cardiolipin synthase n=1 Tax=Clostridium felsineum TaxID=36839 RepID=A0A1S8L2J7_9CLOT|nr:cardiolipin synthase [Clostridium felsineum]URZ03235.1 Cardiolipin synthase [Clostridium felsineum]URZ08426.1 Cardiolipin synthase [Clostridium felsineum]URZ13457.1 Cardiolipin synthase [Clostridium felsineum]